MKLTEICLCQTKLFQHVNWSTFNQLVFISFCFIILITPFLKLVFYTLWNVLLVYKIILK